MGGGGGGWAGGQKAGRTWTSLFGWVPRAQASPDQECARVTRHQDQGGRQNQLVNIDGEDMEGERIVTIGLDCAIGGHQDRRSYI